MINLSYEGGLKRDDQLYEMISILDAKIELFGFCSTNCDLMSGLHKIKVS